MTSKRGVLRRKRAEQPERRVRQRRHPVAERLQAREGDRRGVERDEHVRQAGGAGCRLRRVHRSDLPHRDCRRVPAMRENPGCSKSRSGPRKCAAALASDRRKGNASTTRIPRSRERSERMREQRARDASPPQCRVDDEAQDDGGFVRRHVDRRRRHLQPGEAMRELVPRLRVQPADDATRVVIGEEALHFADLDARADRGAVRISVKRRPVERRRRMEEVAIAAGPRGIVRERATALVIEEVEVVLAARRREGRDAPRALCVHRVIFARSPRRVATEASDERAGSCLFTGFDLGPEPTAKAPILRVKSFCCSSLASVACVGKHRLVVLDLGLDVLHASAFGLPEPIMFDSSAEFLPSSMKLMNL